MAKHVEERLTVYHPRFEGGLKILKKCYKSAGTTDEPDCKVFFGPSGSGKSTLAKTFVAQYPAVDRKTHRETPVLFVQVPAFSTVKSFEETLLYKLGDPLWDRGTVFAKSIRFRTICKECKVRMIILDDFQHFVDYRRNIPTEVAEWLKEQMIQMEISVAAFGLDRCLKVFEQNEQLRRRFGAPIPFGQFLWKEGNERKDFRTFLHSVEESMPDFSMPQLNVDFCFRMHYASYGLVGYAMKIIRGAIRSARRRCTSEITLRMFEESFAEQVWDEPSTGPNPFSKEFYRKRVEPDRSLPKPKEVDPPIKSRRRKSRLRLTA
jgi:hypothetical protein